MSTLLSDLRYGLRMLTKNPGFSAVAILTLALGIGANTAIFSVVDAVLLRPLPYKDPAKLVVMREKTHRVGDVSVSYPDFLDWRQQSRTFAAMAAAHNVGFNLGGIAQPENVGGYAVSPNFLSLLGVKPILGRDFLPSEDAPGTAPVALLSYRLWQSHFGSDPEVTGKVITLDGLSYIIVGVLPPSFKFLEDTDVLTPVGVFAKDLMERGSRGDMDVVGRLGPRVTFREAVAEMDTIAARLAQQYPSDDTGVGISMVPIRDAFVGDSRQAILVLFTAVLFVLLIACVNVANLFLVRRAARAKEIALRLAFGAGRGRVVRQMLTESFLFAALGGVVGVALGAWGLGGLTRLLPQDSLQSMGIRIDRPVFLFAAALIILVAVAFGLVPALQVTRPDVQETLKEGGRSSTPGAGQHRLRSVLVIAETALALVLLAGAGLMMRSLYRLLQVNPGFRPESVVQMEMNLRSAQYSKDPAVRNFWQQTLDRVRVLPGVEAAALGTNIPLTDNHGRGDITIEGQPLPGPGEFPHPDFHSISTGFVRAFGLPLLRGRTFTEDDNENAPLVALVNSSLAKHSWPGQDPLGKRFLLGHPYPNKKWVTIVGVVGDTKMYGLANPSRLEIYLPFRQEISREMNLVVRSATDPASLVPAIRTAVAAVDKDQPVFGVETMKQLVSDSVSTRRLTLVLLALFSALALVLAAIGIYGVMSYSVAQRTHEIGIRIAVGAQQKDVLGLVLGEGTRLALWGVGLGVAAALGFTRLLSSLLFDVSASDPLTYVGVSVALVLVALIACYIPARRALRVDPIVALRYE
ncbi:MAG TPA: ABC transporter permease [Terriglobia bacterium]|nr:ABC transporter permease [Terriglobia bacterium]